MNVDMRVIGTQARRDAMAKVLKDRGYMAASERCKSDPTWESHYADLLGSMYDSLTIAEVRAIFPWNLNLW